MILADGEVCRVGKGSRDGSIDPRRRIRRAHLWRRGGHGGSCTVRHRHASAAFAHPTMLPPSIEAHLRRPRPPKLAMTERGRRKPHPVIARRSCAEAIQLFLATLDCFAALAMTGRDWRESLPLMTRCSLAKSTLNPGFHALPGRIPRRSGAAHRIRKRNPPPCDLRRCLKPQAFPLRHHRTSSSRFSRSYPATA